MASKNKQSTQTNRPEEIIGQPKERSEVIQKLQQSPVLYAQFLRLTEQMQEDLVAFCMGVKGLNVTYDRVFKTIFDPAKYPERLEDFLSHCLGKRVKILQVMPNESRIASQEGALMVMDIVIRLETGEIVNVEIQRIGYMFPGQRCACYSSDLLLRQYHWMKLEAREQNHTFSYRNMKTVYTIVLFQKSSAEFHALPNQYLHYGKQVFNTGLKLDMVQEYLLIPLDLFMKNRHNIIKETPMKASPASDLHCEATGSLANPCASAGGAKETHNQCVLSKLDAWLYFLGSDSLQDIQRVIEAYPEFAELYRQVFRFRYQMKEVLEVYSEVLAELDRNTAALMVEQQEERIKQQQTKIDQQQAKIGQQQAKIGQQQAENHRQQAEIDRLKAEVARLTALLK